ncbi:MAG: response regulator transcription factor [Oscillospiraceae bacterium]
MIYLLEDDDNIRKLVCYALTKDGYETKGFAVPSEFWTEFRIAEPQLLILDIMLPEEDGLTVLKKLRDGGSSVPVIMLTAKSSEFDKVTGLDSGADDYLAKPFGMTELSARVRALLRRSSKGTAEEKPVLKTGGIVLDDSKHIVRSDGEEITLSFKEYSLLAALMKANGRVVSRDKLLTDIWGEFYEDSRTLDVHIRKLRVKLGENGALIKTVKNVGYRIGGENTQDD